MSKNTTVTLSIRIKGTAAADLSRMGRDQVQVAQKVNQTWSMTAKAQGDFVNMSRRATQETKQTARAGDQVLRTNRMLEGVLRQQAIQTRLLSQQAKSQTRDYTLQTRMLSEQARHARDLQRSMAGAAQSQRSMGQSGIGTGGLVQGAAGVAGGVYAASQIVGRPIDGARDFQRVAAQVANIIGSGQNKNPEQRFELSKKIGQDVFDAAFKGGSSSEGLMRAGNALAASGLYDQYDEWKKALDDTSARAFAAAADPEVMARLRGTLRMSKIEESEIPRTMTMLHASGDVGGFEIADMANEFPKLLTEGGFAGYAGYEGALEMATMSQVIKKHAPTGGQAATYLSALLSTLGGNRLTRELDENITWQKGDPFRVDAQGRALKNKQGLPIFDSAKHFELQAMQGVESAPAHIDLIKREIASRKNIQELQQKLTEATSAEEKANIQKAIQVATKNVMAQMFVRQEQLMGLLPLMSSYADGSYDEIKQTTQTKTNAMEEAKLANEKQEFAVHDTLKERRLKAEYDSYMGIADGLTTVKTAISNWAGSNEGIAAAGTAATYSLLAVAAAGGIAAMAMGGGKGVKPLLATTGKWLARVGAPVAVGMGVLNHNQIQADQSLTQDQKNIAQSGNVGGTVGALAGAYYGAALGAPFGGFGAIPGAVIGGGLGYWGGSSVAEAGMSAQIAYQNQVESDRQIAAVEKQTQEIVKALQTNQQPREIFGRRALFNAMNETVNQEALRGAAMPP